MKKHMKILVGVDGSDHSIKVLNEAAQIAKKFDGAITIITVYTKENQDELEKLKQIVESLLDKNGTNYVFSPIFGSNPSRAILDAAAQEKVDLIVVGSRGLGKAAAFLLGSISKEVVSSSPCTVLVVK